MSVASSVQIILVMTCGIPRSGKSSWAITRGIPVVNPDAIRLALHGQPHLKEAEPMVWTMAHYMVESLFLAGHQTVILDATNTTRRRRLEWKSKKWKRVYKVFDTSKEVCIQRAEQDQKDYLIPVINRMNKQFENIQDDENDFEKEHIKWLLEKLG